MKHILWVTVVVLVSAFLISQGKIMSPFVNAEQNENDTVERLANVEKRIQELNKAQLKLQALVQKLDLGVTANAAGSEANVTGKEPSDLGAKVLAGGEVNEILKHTKLNFKEQQVKRLIDSGFVRERAEHIISLKDKYFYEQMLKGYKLRHMPDHSSSEARNLIKEMHMLNSPHIMMHQELSKEEFNLYMKSQGLSSEFTVGDMIPGSPAVASGINPGDRITSYNDLPVFSIHDLRLKMQNFPPGQAIPIELIRKGSRVTETIYVPSGPLGILTSDVSGLPVPVY
ncbi:PDZ domain-containing protein [Microbulbifer epialgicus]|uniref:PDZ domain-containing protein n=1 Tax=Microbulbifer epialgicus TaxID=393907 RepID=A0ABV4P306_9GAMM